MQKEIVEKAKLLDEQGNIATPGYAKTYMLGYDRADIKAKKSRIKEWDYFYIQAGDYALCLTVADMGYVGAISATVMDFVTPSQVTQSAVCLFPMGKYKMPPTPERGDITAKAGKAEITITNDGKQRHLVGKYPKFDNGKELRFDVVIDQFPKEYMFIATPFDTPKYFYYNCKLNCMRANGKFWVGDREYLIEDQLATLDWGRGVWTYDNTWYWGSLQTRLEDGSLFGFNLGYGFGNTSAASENMLFYNGTSHKLEDVTFHIPGDNTKDIDYMKEWKFTSSDGRLEMSFKPIIDRYAPFDLKVMCMIPHQVFGLFSGKAVLDDGKEIILKDVLGFAEKVHNKW